MIRSGKYTVDSIENGLVKILYNEDERIEEVISQQVLSHSVKQGDVIEIKFEHSKIISTLLVSETALRKEQAKSMLEKLKNKKQ